MKKMKKIFYLILALFASSNLFANNLIIGTPTYNGTANTLTFTIKWDNCWRVNSGPTNYDAVWLFVKRQPCGANGIWSHALLNATPGTHTVTGSFNLVVDPVTDGMGVFIHRSTSANNQIGSLTTTSSVVLQLTNSYNPDLIGSSSSSDNFKVMGIEMVYVPQGNFNIGDGRAFNSSNFSNGNTVGALEINSAKQAAGLGLYSNYTSKPSYACVLSLPSAFPLGYNGFYCMKYEINQQQIVDYLNTLNYELQAARLAVWGARYPNVNGTFFSYAVNNYRSEIKVITAGTSNTIPAIFGLANAWNAYLPAGYLNWQDLASYLDWCGLRPMTEFEFEKACRGTETPLANGYPWGTNIINTSSGGFASQNTSSESANTAYEGICWYNWDGGPVRSGFAATTISNRTQSGATYYGIMEMAGNLYEQCIGGGTGYDYSTFTIANGNGILTVKGLADVAGWPESGGLGSGTILRGGGFYTNTGQKSQMEISDRQFYLGTAENANSTRNRSIGGRGVRSYSN